VQPLVAHRWVTLGPGPDARSRVLALTDAGRAKRAEAARVWKRAQVALNDKLGAERVAHLHAVLEDCLARLEAGEPLEEAA
jgi:DNA-binding MarR family transcriptional regulator